MNEGRNEMEAKRGGGGEERDGRKGVGRKRWMRIARGRVTKIKGMENKTVRSEKGRRNTEERCRREERTEEERNGEKERGEGKEGGRMEEEGEGRKSEKDEMGNK